MDEREFEDAFERVDYGHLAGFWDVLVFVNMGKWVKGWSVGCRVCLIEDDVVSSYARNEKTYRRRLMGLRPRGPPLEGKGEPLLRPTVVNHVSCDPLSSFTACPPNVALFVFAEVVVD